MKKASRRTVAAIILAAGVISCAPKVTDEVPGAQAAVNKDECGPPLVVTHLGTSSPRSLVHIGDTLFFILYDGASFSIWRSDGTDAGTVKVRDGFAAGPFDLRAVGGRLYFTADDGVHGFELWSSDGTSEGTAMVRDINPGPESFPSNFVENAGKVYFTASTATGSTGQLWVTDGSEAGTALVKDIAAGDQFVSIFYLVSVPGGTCSSSAATGSTATSPGPPTVPPRGRG